jgi:hypothetical protein
MDVHDATSIEELLQATEPGSKDRLMMRLFIETDADPRKAFERFADEYPIDTRFWAGVLVMAIEEVNPGDLAALADKPVQLPSIGAPCHLPGSC